ncbi:MAG: ATP-dependent zinc metalloprotease FtsH [Candidatus Omnitrophica bacterium]|nr:ATP-dependent zinc metalloprotease FtsH [Candidatus Omnitrophota bacterium]
MFLGAIWVFNLFNMGVTSQMEKLRYDEFYYLVENNLEQPVIRRVKKMLNFIEGEYTAEYASSKGKDYFHLYIPEEDKEVIPLIRKNVKEFVVEPPRTAWTNFFISLFPVVVFIAFLWYLSNKGNQMGSRVWGFGKSRAKILEKGKTLKVTFHDVAGIDEAKEELKEVIMFLKDPKRFQRLGGRIPKGVLLVGPPGCGKTLLAKAVAGEAEVPFSSISGSDFVELFVGVGASRVRDLFEQSKKAAKVRGKGCIVFIDEIDAVGRQRFAGIGGGHDEREQTLNQLLVEMDGFQTDQGVIVMAATNRPDVLDPALLRPGRFDRHIVIDAPDIKGREAILKVHTKKIKLAKEVDLSVIAKQTPGFSGADLENLCNEGALLAARREKNDVGNDELQEAMERVIAGPQRKSRVIPKKEKEITAFHEAGHALLHLYLKNVDPLHKVSIIPRGVNALGYTMPLPVQDRYTYSRSELLDKICSLFGGMAAEELILKEVTTGAQNDLEVATKIARRMVSEFGMSERIGHMVLGKSQGPVFLGRDLAEHKNYSEEMATAVDDEIKKIVEAQYQCAKDILQEHIEELRIVALVLLEKEVLTVSEVKEAIGFKDADSTSCDS